MMPSSVIIPVWNEPRARLNATIRSAVLAGAGDIVVIDDGSDPYVEIEASPIVSVFRQEHQGIAAAMNHGVRRVKYPDNIAPCAVGDYLSADALDLHMAVAGPSFGSWEDAITGKVNHPPDNWADRIWTDNQFSLGTALFSADDWAKVGGFDESLMYSVDWSFSLRLHAAVGWTRIDAVLLVGAEYPDGHTAKADFRRKCYDNAMVSRWARAHERDVA